MAHVRPVTNIRLPAFRLSTTAPGPGWPLLEWQVLTPPSITDPLLCSGMAVDPTDPAIVLVGNAGFDEEFAPGADNGLYRTEDYGANWVRGGYCTPTFEGAEDHIEGICRIRIDPNNSSRVFIVAGVRGTNQGFFVSTDGGLNATRSSSLPAALISAGVSGPGTQDLYDIACDPEDFDHILVSFHYFWDGGFGSNSGIAESFNGGTTWTIHAPESSWGTGHSIHFLGNSSTWLLGTQGDGKWLTTNSGTSWTQVSEENIAHGGATTYYSTELGCWYITGETQTERSFDDGETWEAAHSMGSWSIVGDGTSLYCKHAGANAPMQTSLETSGTSWGNLNAESFLGGALEMCYDATSEILWFAGYNSGVRAIRLREA